MTFFITEDDLKEQLKHCKLLVERLYNAIKKARTPYEADKAKTVYEDLITHALISIQTKVPKRAALDVEFVRTFLQGAIERFEDPKRVEEVSLAGLGDPQVVSRP